ncbi:MAG: glycosyltransferase family 4 protein [Vicinamibacterales bacterium]
MGLKIALDLTCLPAQLGGVGFYLTHLIEGFQELQADDEFVLLLPASRQPLVQVSAPHVRVVCLSDRSRPARLWWEQAELVTLAQELGVHVLHSPHYTRPLRALPCASVVGLMDMTFFLLPEEHTAVKRTFFRFMIPRSAALADRLLAISESTKRDACEYLGIDPARIDVTLLAPGRHYRADLPERIRRDVATRYKLPGHYILFVGTLEPRKNLPRLLVAYEALAREGSAPPLVLVGARGWHTTELEARLASARTAGTVLELGYVPEEDLPAVYAGATVFVYPSLYEGFGIPVAEGLASGVPVITSNRSSMPEVAGDAAVLVDPLSSEEIASAIRKLLDDDRLRADLSRKGLARAAALSWRNTAAQTVECYRRAYATWRAVKEPGRVNA